MLKMILDEKVIYVLMGGAAACGIISKLVVSVALKRLVRASGSMNKSTHPLMRLVRAKFEHACMISEKVENVKVFVDKYLYEYRVLGMKLHSLRRLECTSAGLCLILGLAGAIYTYVREGMKGSVLRLGAAGGGLAILVFLVHLMTDEKYRMDVIRNYMVDYLENICLHRYGKSSQRNLKVVSPEVPVPDFGQVAEDDALLEEPQIIPGLYDKPEIPDNPRYPDKEAVTEYPEEFPKFDRQADITALQEDTPDTPPRLRAVKFRKKPRTLSHRETISADGSAIKPLPLESSKFEESRSVRKSQDIQEPHSTQMSHEQQEPQDAVDILAAAVKASAEIKTEAKTERNTRKEKQQDPAKEILIRQILEEFMA